MAALVQTVVFHMIFQRKDYSALTKFLPPKFEYVISVRLAPVQMELYQKYLDIGNVSSTISGKGARLFKDYQALMRIWTHPWVLKLDEIRQENKVSYNIRLKIYYLLSLGNKLALILVIHRLDKNCRSFFGIY